MSVFDTIKKTVKKAANKATGNYNTWDMSTKEAREKQVKRDYEYAKMQRGTTTERFIELDNYYNNLHYSAREAADLADKYNLDAPPVLTDPFIQVESQIEAEVPDFQFSGRDDDLDSVKAKVREDVTRFVCDNNHIDDMNPDQERRLGKLGNAFWKVSFDGDIVGPGYVGEIIIGDPDPANMFNDPSSYDIDDCEFLIYAFRMHRRAARRKFGEVIDSIGNDGNYGDTEIYSSATRDMFDDTVQVIEYWYRDDEGDIACSIQVGEKEVRHIPKYWENTRHSGNKMYPFVKYCKTPNAKSFWDRSEIDTIKDLIDAGDREFMTAIMNDGMVGNDIIVREQNAFVDEDFMPNNMPGADWVVKQGQINAVRRLGGIANNTNALNMINFIHDKIEETNGNFATKGSDPPAGINTASGLAMLREDRENRSTPKKLDRQGGFRRLYELIDWSALEFYNQDRIIMIRGKTKQEQSRAITFNSEQFKQPVPRPQDPLDFQATGEDAVAQPAQEYYYPRIDCEIQVGQGIAKSPALTLQFTQELAKMNITPVNVELVCSMVDQAGLNDGQKIKESMRQAVQQQAQGGAGGELGNTQLPEAAPEEIMEFLHSLPEKMAQFIIQNTPSEVMPQVVAQLMQIPAEQLQQLTPEQLAQLIGGVANGQGQSQGAA